MDIQDNYDKVYDMTGEFNGMDVSRGSRWTDDSVTNVCREDSLTNPTNSGIKYLNVY